MASPPPRSNACLGVARPAPPALSQRRARSGFGPRPLRMRPRPLYPAPSQGANPGRHPPESSQDILPGRRPQVWSRGFSRRASRSPSKDAVSSAPLAPRRRPGVSPTCRRTGCGSARRRPASGGDAAVPSRGFAPQPHAPPPRPAAAPRLVWPSPLPCPADRLAGKRRPAALGRRRPLRRSGSAGAASPAIRPPRLPAAPRVGGWGGVAGRRGGRIALASAGRIARRRG